MSNVNYLALAKTIGFFLVVILFITGMVLGTMLWGANFWNVIMACISGLIGIAMVILFFSVVGTYVYKFFDPNYYRGYNSSGIYKEWIKVDN